MEPFEFMECSFCNEEVIEFAAIFSSDKRYGEKACKHNFCSPCIQHFMEYSTRNNKQLICPLCREEFDGFIQNKTSNDLLKHARSLSSTSIFLKLENTKLNTELNQQKIDSENKVVEYRNKLKELEEYKTKSLQEAQGIREKIRDMENTISELEQTRLSDLESSQLKIDGQAQQLLQLTQSNRELSHGVQSIHIKNNDLLEQISSLQQQVEEFKQHIQLQDDSLEKIESEKRTLHGQLQNIERVHQGKMEQQLSLAKVKDLQIAKLSYSNQTMSENLLKLQVERDQFKKLFDEIKEDSNSGFKKNKDLEGAISALHIELSRSQSVIEMLNMKKHSLEKELEETRLFQTGRGGSANGANIGSSFTSSLAPPAIMNTANKITNSSYNIINNSIGYLMGKPHTNANESIVKPYKSFKIQEKRGNRGSQIHKVSASNGNNVGNYVIKLIPLVSMYSGGYRSITSLYNSIYSSSLTDQDLLVFRESMLLYKLNHGSILKLESITKDDSTGKFYSVLSPFVPLDLEFVMAENQTNSAAGGRITPTTLTFSNIKYIIYQLISVVNYLHSQDLVHRDIKPTSILLFNDHQIKLCSFGFATSVFTFQNSISIPTYTNSFSYLAPEFIVGQLNIENSSKLLKEIDWKAFDMWSIGCIFLELIFKRKLFDNNNIVSMGNGNNNSVGSNNINNINNVNNNNVNNNNNNNNNSTQQQQLYSVLNNISSFKESSPKNGSLFFKDNNIVVKSKVENDFSSANLPTDAYSLLCSLLSFNPATRIKSNHAVFHRFFKDEPYFVCDSSSVSPNTTNDISSTLTDRNIRPFLKEKCSSIIQV